MKKTNLIIMLGMMLCLSSCGACRDYKRSQAEFDATSKGKQILLEAESSKKAKIETAKADREASIIEAETKVTVAKAAAQAEIERARGVAEANKIIGESLKGNDSYLRYLWVTGINDGKGERIYIPTEGNLPILEAK